MIWTCKNCGLVLPMEPHEFPIYCRCGLIQKTHDAEPVIPNGITVKEIIANPCKHQLPTIEHRECKGCRGMVKIKVNGCEKHGECTIVYKFAGVMACTRCDDYLETVESTSV